MKAFWAVDRVDALKSFSVLSPGLQVSLAAVPNEARCTVIISEMLSSLCLQDAESLADPSGTDWDKALRSFWSQPLIALYLLQDPNFWVQVTGAETSCGKTQKEGTAGKLEQRVYNASVWQLLLSLWWEEEALSDTPPLFRQSLALKQARVGSNMIALGWGCFFSGDEWKVERQTWACWLPEFRLPSVYLTVAMSLCKTHNCWILFGLTGVHRVEIKDGVPAVGTAHAQEIGRL